MKKTLSIIIAFVASLQFAFSQNVTINDPNFLAALITNSVDTNNDGIIQTSEAQAKTALYLSNDNISDASGIEAFTNLELLFISNNNLTELDVTKNVNLTYLNFSVNNISNIDLSKNTKLQTLLCASTHVLTNLDLSQNKSLTSLECTGNKITSFDLSYNPELTVLHCSDNLMTKIDLRNNHKVKEVWAYNDVPNLKMICLSTESMLLLKNDGSPFMGNGKFIWSTTCELPLTTGIENATIENIGIYPNPSNGIIHISNNQYFTDLKISNLNAETVFSSTLSESLIQSFDINTLPTGIYVIELSNGFALQKSKLVKL